MALPQGFDWLRTVVDILIVAFLFYRLFILVRGTRAIQMFIGLVTLVILSAVAQWLHLAALNWLLDSLRTVWVIAFIIIFQPELRKALTQIGQSRLFNRFVTVSEFAYLNEVQNGVERASRKGLGALLVLERNIGLKNFIETGTRIEAAVSAELLETIFTPPSPLHDGAVVLRGNQIVAAGCILPISSNPDLEKTLGMRHRAAAGLSEETDAIVIVVSEETRQISIAENGALTRNLQIGELKSRLSALLKIKPAKAEPREGREARSQGA
ncbi:MAG: TIGR00159 family protein [Candidatus Eisenbacteria bacterium]|uniref:Diadenylate cyclase n=1 Tax=Eiseniibacteriota bacterium TaxID=2212470 RepID=A0A938BL86_UNCEI|nr:TIGR00159 family protein [Candidatus Eisenbacteria bacterium]